MLQFYYNPKYKYTNRSLIDISSDSNYVSKDYANIDSPDTINGHIIYQLTAGETLPTYILDTENNRRWFVSGITQLRSGKYQISLLRDILSEGLQQWKSEEAYINAGLATDYNKYKTWQLPFTNTKVKEERLNINGKSSFFVYYVNTRNVDAQNVLTEADLQIKSSLLPGITNYDYSVSSLSELPGFEYIGAGDLKLWNINSCNIKTVMFSPISIGGTSWRNITAVYNNGVLELPLTYESELSPVNYNNNVVKIAANEIAVSSNANNCLTDLESAITTWINTYKNTLGAQISQNSASTLINNYKDKIIYNTTDQKIYVLRATKNNMAYNTALGSGNEATTLATAIRNINWPIPYPSSDNIIFYGNWLNFNSSADLYNFTLEEIGTALNCDFTFIANQRKLPKSAVRCVNIVSDNTISDQDLAQTLMVLQENALNLNEDSGRILDIQYLPFSVATSTNDNIKVNNVSMVAKFLDMDDFYYITDLTDLQNINKETDTIKIVSPSRASQFVFSPYNNNGNMLFQTSITIKPYSSIIYIRPSTQGLLINDWDDKDCLIISEDFSLTAVNSEWANYIYQNRNYENAFNRQIQGREFERTWEKRVEQAQAKSDEWTARNISSQKAQTYTGNLPIISSIAGAIGSAWQDQDYLNAAKTDREYNEALYQESVSIAKDNFSYQIDNLKSQPGIPTKVTTIDIKHLDGVYLEFYSTNSTELAAINNFYKYNGNRIDAYGTFNQYYGWFVRGKIIKSLNYTQPEINEINRRLNLGIFTEVNYA